MKLLELTKENTCLLDNVFSDDIRFDFSVNSVIDSRMCSIYVDDILLPTAFMLTNGIFRVFAGDCNSSVVSKFIETMPNNSIVLPSHKGWFNKIRETKNIGTELFHRHSMHHNKIDIENLKRISPPDGYNLKRIDLIDAELLSQSPDFKYHLQNFKNAEDFVNRGLGYIAKYNSTIIGAATSALVCKKGIEINIMVLPIHRKNGVALSLGANFVSDVLSQKLIPNWDAGNLASKSLAQKLGYEFNKSYEVIRVMAL
jgi:hypothetical protein